MTKRRLLQMVLWLLCCTQCTAPIFAQEAGSGFDLRATLTGQMMASNTLTEAPRSGAPVAAGFHTILYPTWKIDNHWFVTGALEFVTRPYFYEDFSTAGYGARGYVLQANLNYSRVSDKGSLLVRIGQLSTAFGSFMLRYDDADNPLADLPIEYGYYYMPVSTQGLAGGEIDATRHNWDVRAQFTNSSPANPRSLFEKDQYGNWAGGAGYTIRQGLRVGVSGYYGPYLARDYKFFFPGEANPNTTPAHALGADIAWSHRHTSVQGEVQKFVMPYTVLPTRREWAAYGEVKQVMGPRWYLAARSGFTYTRGSANERNVEAATGIRPNRFQLIKIDYELEHLDSGVLHNENSFAIQLVTSFHSAFSHN